MQKKSRLIQISTVSIAGDSIDQKIPKDTRLAESDFYLGQEVTSNKYIYSKFQAKELVLAAIGQGILDGKIIRVGNLMSRISDGEFQINFSNNAFMRDLRSYAIIGKFPILAGTNPEFTVFHAVNSHRVLIAYKEGENHMVEEIDHEDFFTVKALYRLNCRLWQAHNFYQRNAANER
ncbi:MAG: NAD-dependent epimerase/dehydratase family protein [Selenomonadaceae bacterium]|nr:NAD-dependent epimerase/dehydratase family protein [Selenomonadaceae bacterium]